MRLLFILFVLLFAACMSGTTPIIETLRLKPGEDIYLVLQEYANTNKIEAAYVTTCVGSVTEVTIRYANQGTPEVLKGHFEITSLVGTFSIHGSHLHITVADSVGTCKGGHLTKGSKVYTTAEIVIGILPGIEYLRETDSTYGYKELVVKKR